MSTITRTAGYPSPANNAWGSGRVPAAVFTPPLPLEVRTRQVASNAWGSGTVPLAVRTPPQTTLNTSPAKVNKLFQTAKKSTAQASKPTLLNQTKMVLKSDDILKLRFSQDSVKNETTDGIALEDLKDDMLRNGWKKNTSIQIVKMYDGVFTSKDNRRPLAAKWAVETDPTTKLAVVAKAYDHTIRAPAWELQNYREHCQEYRSEFDRFADYHVYDIPLPALPPGVKAGTQGELISLRMNSGEGDTDSQPYGFTEKPYIRRGYNGY